MKPTFQFAFMICIVCCHGIAQPSSDAVISDTSLFRAEASVRADSAILDQETGRVFWEGSSSLHASIVPKIRVIPHFRATVFSAVLWVAGVRYILDTVPWRQIFARIGLVRRELRSPAALAFASSSGGGRISMMMLPRTIISFFVSLVKKFKIPEIPRGLLIMTIIFYLIESFTSSTHRYLWNVVPNIEETINEIQQLQPTVEWKVRTFHYGFYNIIKRVSATSTEAFQYKSCKDRSFAGLWKRSLPSNPFIKATLTKIIVLSPKARRSYFQQQAIFLRAASTDIFSEFSTKIHIGTRQRLFQSEYGVWWRTLYWICTLSGFTLPFRWWITANSNDVKVIIVKELYEKNVNDSQDEFVLPAIEEASG